MTNPRPLILALIGALLAGCITEGGPRTEPAKPRPAPREATTPAKVIVSPLTRIGFDGSGAPCIFLHLDFRDASEKSIKAYGRLHVELFQPTPTTATPADPKSPPATQKLDMSWNDDLRDPVRNALTFDEMITRTYTINLTQIPEWLIHWARRDGDQAGAASPTIVVQYLNNDTTDASKAIRMAHTLTR